MLRFVQVEVSKEDGSSLVVSRMDDGFIVVKDWGVDPKAQHGTIKLGPESAKDLIDVLQSIVDLKDQLSPEEQKQDSCH